MQDAYNLVQSNRLLIFEVVNCNNLVFCLHSFVYNLFSFGVIVML